MNDFFVPWHSLHWTPNTNEQWFVTVTRIDMRQRLDELWYPFLQPFHAGPYDYGRVTLLGIKTQFERFDPLDMGICVGPGSSVTWILVEYVQLFVSHSVLRKVAKYTMQILLFPLKYVDRWVMRKQDAHIVASGFYYLGIKSG